MHSSILLSYSATNTVNHSFVHPCIIWSVTYVHIADQDQVSPESRALTNSFLQIYMCTLQQEVVANYLQQVQPFQLPNLILQQLPVLGHGHLQ